MKKSFFNKVTPALLLLTAGLLAGTNTIHADAADLTYEAAALTETILDKEIKEYSFTTLDKAVFTTITVTNTTCKNLTVSVLDKDGKELYKKNSSTEKEQIHISFDTEKLETYRIMIQGNDGSYTLDLDYSEDLGGSNENSCTTLIEGKEYSWRMDGKADVDYAIYTPSQAGDTKVTLTNKDCDAKLEAKIIHVKSGKQIFSTSTGAAGGTAATATHTLTSGDTYLIKIDGASNGNYSLKMEQQKITNITLPTSSNVTAGTTFQLQPTITQTGASEPFITYKSSSPSIATVDSQGNVATLKAGKVTITATATDGFGVKAKTVLYVSPQQMAAPVVKATSSSKLRVTWNKLEGASGYFIYQYDTRNQTWELVGTTSKGSTEGCTITKLSPATAYQFKISAYKNIGNELYEGELSASASCMTPPAKTPISSISYSKGKLKVTPKKPSYSVTGYEIRYSDTKKFSSYYKHRFTKSSVSFRPHLASGKWYMQVRTYKTFNGKRVYGKWSSTKSFTIK